MCLSQLLGFVVVRRCAWVSVGCHLGMVSLVDPQPTMQGSFLHALLTRPHDTTPLPPTPPHPTPPQTQGNATINKHLLQIMSLLLPMRRVCSGKIASQWTGGKAKLPAGAAALRPRSSMVPPTACAPPAFPYALPPLALPTMQQAAS